MRPDTGNLGDVFAAYSDSESTAVIDLRFPDAPKEISHRALNDAVDGLARGLVRAGFNPGDRVGILSLNRVEFLEVLFGAMRAGCVPVMINAKLPADQVRYIVKDAGANIVFCEEDLSPLCDPGTRTINFDDDEYRDFVDTGVFESFVPGPTDIAEQPYTSGSTGRPKGVLLHHVGQR